MSLMGHRRIAWEVLLTHFDLVKGEIFGSKQSLLLSDGES